MDLGADELPWFEGQPELSHTLVWEAPAVLRGSNIDEIEVSFWRVLTHAAQPDPEANAIQFVDPPRRYGVVVETRCSLRSQKPEGFPACVLEWSVTLSLTEDQKGDGKPRPPSIAAVWPRGHTTPVSVARGRTRNGKLSVKATPLEVSVGSDQKWEEQYERQDPQCLVVPAIRPTHAQITWKVTATDAAPSIEGLHYGGAWLTSDNESFLQVVAKVKVWPARRLGRGGWRTQNWKDVPLQDRRWTVALMPIAGPADD